MIEIIAYRPTDRVRIEIKGHAGYAEHGRDIICSAVSILYYTLKERACDIDQRAVSVSGTSGNAHIDIKIRNANMRECVDTIMTGFRMLSTEYPNNVRLKETT